MRTTLSLQDDAAKIIRAYAKQRKLSLGEAASELVRRGAGFRVEIRRVDGFALFDVPDDFPIITNRQVRELLES